MRWMLACTLAACSSVYGLDETYSVDPDKDGDHDGVQDERDNCPEVANNDQTDTDRDGLGDACDHCVHCAPCETPANHDEDGDEIDDGCDNCPATNNPGQENLDGDDAGDVCDVDNAVAHRRVLFEGFDQISEDWLQGGAPWKSIDDAATPSPSLSSPPYILRPANLQVTATSSWVIELGISPGTNGGGIYLPSSIGNSTVHCAVLALFPGPQWQMVSGIGAASGTFDVTPQMRLRLSLSAANVRCDLVDVHARDSTITPQYPYNLNIQTTGKFAFSYIDVLSR